MHNEAAMENLWKLWTEIINRPMRLQVIICLKKRAPFFAFFYKTRANTQQVLSVQIGLYRSDEWMMQDIKDKNLNGS